MKSIIGALRLQIDTPIEAADFLAGRIMPLVLAQQQETAETN